MADAIRFRTALNGFHREDVVHHLEYLQNRHAAQVAQLKQELAEARQAAAQGEQLRDMLDDLRRQYAQLESERDAALARAEVLEREKRDAHPTASVGDAELETYRRAERAERQAQQRADQLLAQAHALLADAGIRAEENAAQIGLAAERAAAELTALQQAVQESRGVMQDVAAAMRTMRPQDAQ